jgi:sec-independent protein translocase protein TatA
MRILKSEARAMNDDAAPQPAARPHDTTASAPPPRLIQAAPGETATARPATGSDPAAN